MTLATDLERYMLGLINQARADVGLPPLTLEQNLNASADAHSIWMNVNNSFSHEGVDGGDAGDRIVTAGFDLGTDWSWAENIGAFQIINDDGFFDEVDSIFASWLNSTTHSGAILNADYDFVGLGITIGTLPLDNGDVLTGLIATQNFATSNGIQDLDVQGTDEAETLRGAAGDDHIDGGGANDILLGNGGSDTLRGGDGEDSMNGHADDDALFGAAGNDFLRGEDGNDTLLGGSGDDFAIGDAGNDVLLGGIGQDSLSGGLGNDLMLGGAGFDVLQGGAGDDTLQGGEQADNLFASGGNDLLQGGNGFDRLFGGAGDDTLQGGGGGDALFGNGGADVMMGEDGDDRNYGAGGNDLITDGLGNDLLEAGAGFDTLDGGAGDDMLFGRFNADTFVFTDIAGGFGNDTIGDFAATNPFERIDLSGVAAITDLTDLMANHVDQIGDDVLITAGVNSTILLVGVTLAQLDMTDFTF